MPSPRSRAIAIGLVATTVAATCVALGLWQLRRLDDRRALNAAILAQRSRPPIDVTDAAPVPFRPVTATGVYDLDREVLVYGRSRNAEAGHHVLTPLVLADGSAVLVLRGWVPFPMQEVPVTSAAPVSDEVTVEGFLLRDGGDGSARPDADRIVRVLDVEGVAASLPYETLPMAVQLERQTPPQPGLPLTVPPPELSEGPHLSYAVQWFSFAAIAAIGGAMLLRRDRRRS